MGAGQGRVFPNHQIFDDAEEPLPLSLLRLLGLKQIGVRRRIIHHLRKDHRPRRCQRPTRTPQVQCTRVPFEKRVLFLLAP